jgi:hypothetical protein
MPSLCPRIIPLFITNWGTIPDFLDFTPNMIELKTGKRRLPSELKTLSFTSATSVRVAIAALSSSTFFWFWNVLSDCRNLNRRDLLAFPINPDSIPETFRRELSDLGANYLQSLKSTARMMLKSGLHIETFDYVSYKSIINEIDRVLARLYGFTDEELDFIINYDIKYRMGEELFEEEE